MLPKVISVISCSVVQSYTVMYLALFKTENSKYAMVCLCKVLVSFYLQEWYEEYSRTNLQPDEAFHRELDSPEANASNSIN